MAERAPDDAIASRIEQIREDRDLQDWVIDLGPFAVLALLIVVFSLTSPVFLSFNNLVGNVLRNSTILLLVGVAGTFPILQQSIDLSVESLVGITGVVCAILITDFGLGLAALPLAVLLGTFLGFLNGLVFAKFKIPSFLVTLGSLSILAGTALLLTGGTSVPYRNPTIRWVSTGNIVPAVPNLVLWGLAFYLLFTLVAWKTSFGRYCYALGENEEVAELSGVNVDRYKIGAFVASGFLCGVAGALLTARIGSGAPGMGSGLLLQSIAAIVMGGTALTGGVGGPHRTIIGVLVIGVLANGMNLIGIQSFVQDIVLGFVVILAVAMSMDRRKIDIVK